MPRNEGKPRPDCPTDPQNLRPERLTREDHCTFNSFQRLQGIAQLNTGQSDLRSLASQEAYQRKDRARQTRCRSEADP
jgi:hypothetical protein